jgi:hypothetical protein
MLEFGIDPWRDRSGVINLVLFVPASASACDAIPGAGTNEPEENMPTSIQAELAEFRSFRIAALESYHH